MKQDNFNMLAKCLSKYNKLLESLPSFKVKPINDTVSAFPAQMVNSFVILDFIVLRYQLLQLS